MLTRPLFKSVFENVFSLQTDGVDEFVDLGDIANFDKNSVFSLSVWFNTTQTTQAQFMNRIKNGVPFTGWQFYKAADQKLTFSLINNNSTNNIQINGTTLVNDGNWHNAILTYDGSSNASGVTIYLDGVSEALVIVTDNLTLSTLIAQNLLLAKRSADNNFFNGKLDEPAVFSDKELTQAEVTNIYNLGKPKTLLTIGNLLAWWQFTQADKDNFPTIADHSGNGNDGTATNMESGDIQGDTP